MAKKEANGGGKTTLLKAILGLVKPSTGEIRIYGNRQKNKSKFIGYVLQFTKFEKAFPIDVFDVVLMGRLKSSIKIFINTQKKTLNMQRIL